MNCYEMSGRFHWWTHPFVCKKSNKQEQRIRWKMLEGHDSLYSDDKIMEW